MNIEYTLSNNPRVIVYKNYIRKTFITKNENLTFPKHRFKKFIKDVVNGTIERNDLID